MTESLTEAKGCKECGEPTIPTPTGRSSYYCSRKCSRAEEYRNAKSRQRKVKTNCNQCGVEFMMPIHNKGYCSLTCSGLGANGSAGKPNGDQVAPCTCCHAVIGLGGKKSAQIIGTSFSVALKARKDRGVETMLPPGGTWKWAAAKSESFGGAKWDATYKSEWVKDVKVHGKTRVFPDWGNHPEVVRWRASRAARGKWGRSSDYDRMKMRIRTRIYHGLKRNLKGPAKKVAKSEELIGCSYADYQNHIESTFTRGMNWGNWGIGTGKWNIDHIVPCSHFDLNDPGQQRAAFHWSNTEAMWSLLNISKGNRMSEAQPQLLLNK